MKSLLALALAASCCASGCDRGGPPVFGCAGQDVRLTRATAQETRP